MKTTNVVAPMDVAYEHEHTQSLIHRLHEIKIIWMQYHSNICSSRFMQLAHTHTNARANTHFCTVLTVLQSEQKALMPNHDTYSFFSSWAYGKANMSLQFSFFFGFF